MNSEGSELLTMNPRLRRVEVRCSNQAWFACLRSCKALCNLKLKDVKVGSNPRGCVHQECHQESLLKMSCVEPVL